MSAPRCHITGMCSLPSTTIASSPRVTPPQGHRDTTRPKTDEEVTTLNAECKKDMVSRAAHPPEEGGGGLPHIES